MITPQPTAERLPDLADLAALANGFFRALPGGGSPPSPIAPPPPVRLHSPAAPVAAAPLPRGVPDRLDLPAHPLPELPAKQAATPADPYTASLPQVAPLRVPGATGAFYFIAEGGLHPSGSAGEDRITARSFDLPGTVPASVRPPHLEPSELRAFDVEAIRRDFPILAERVNGRQLVWFDNAATTQKPRCVLDWLRHFYEHENSNIHRAAHDLAARATDAYEAARATVQHFLGAASPEEIIFVRGATEGINLIARTWGAANIGPGDEIIVSHLEHHANIVPWQQLAAEKGARLRVIPVDDDGQVLLDEYRNLLCPRTKIVSVTQVSNALGTVVPVREIVALAHLAGAVALVDGAQSVSHMPVNVQEIGADFFVFSGHKVFGPTGIGAVYGRRNLLDAMPAWQGGGNMIADVTFERTLFQPPPNRFEAGTGNIADAVGLGAALDYVQRIGLPNIAHAEHELLAYATRALGAIAGVRLIGTAPDKASVLSFVLKGHDPEEVGRALNREGIAVRSGHHCAQPILRRFGLEATVRPSLAFYNTREEVDRFIAVVRSLAR